MYKYHGGIGEDYVLRGQDMHLELFGGDCKVFNERLSTRLNMNYRSEIMFRAWLRQFTVTLERAAVSEGKHDEDVCGVH